MYVNGASIFYGQSGEPLASYQQRFNQMSGRRLRQINRFAYMGLIGALELVGGRRLPADAGIYLTSINGNITDTESALCQLYGSSRLPMPYNFIHTMANTAAFYLSRELGICGRNLTLSAGALSFERGLAAAMSDFGLGRATEALIGGIDEASGDPRPTGSSPGSASPGAADRYDEGCAWLHVTMGGKAAVGEIENSQSFTCRQKAMDWARRAAVRKPLGLILANRIAASETAAWRQIADTAPLSNTPEGAGAFFESSACAVAEFFRQPAAAGASATLVNRDDAGRYVLTSLRRHGPGE